ncbi:hypothetical protein HKX48_000077 [Thoreauomyces humboldtii]|nr:hypothetical protein HKX48_000077 [Thoreauomyces humboldtii]
MELSITLKTPYRRFMVTDRYKITTSQRLARIHHSQYNQEALFPPTPASGDASDRSGSPTALFGTPTTPQTASAPDKVITDLTWVSCDALADYIMLLAGSEDCVDREVSFELIRRAPPVESGTDSDLPSDDPTVASSSTRTVESSLFETPAASMLRTKISLCSPSFTLASPIVSESWSRHRDWHLRAFDLGAVTPTLQEVNVRGRLARGQFLADLDGFFHLAKTFQEQEQALERTVGRYVKVFRNVLSKQDDGRFSLKQMAFLSCSPRDHRRIEEMVNLGQFPEILKDDRMIHHPPEGIDHRRDGDKE